MSCLETKSVSNASPNRGHHFELHYWLATCIVVGLGVKVEISWLAEGYIDHYGGDPNDEHMQMAWIVSWSCAFKTESLRPLLLRRVHKIHLESGGGLAWCPVNRGQS